MLSDDTVELELTQDELLGLSRAAEASEPAPAPSSSVAAPAPQIRPTGRPDPIAIPFQDGSRPSGRGMAWNVAAVIAFAVFDWWGVNHLFGVQAAQPAMAATHRSSEIVPMVSPATSQPALVRVPNPFDATEVFEFPAGTSAADSREKVAELLLQRARTRRGQPVGIRPATKLRAAKYAANRAVR